MKHLSDKRVSGKAALLPTVSYSCATTKRAEDPDSSKVYADGRGIAESAPNGYFPSCCAPLIYPDNVLSPVLGRPFKGHRTIESKVRKT